MGFLELAIISMHCRITGKSEEELELQHGYQHRISLESKVKSLNWSADKEKDFIDRLWDVQRLYKRRNKFVHIAAGIVGDDSIPNIPTGSVIDVRSYGLGFSNWDGIRGTIGLVARRIDLAEIDQLIDDINKARLGFVPYMDLVDEIKHPPRPFPEPEEGKLIAGF